MKTKKIRNYKVKPVDNSTFKPKQVPELPTLHGIFVATAPRNSGKTQAIADLIRKYDKSFDVVKTICPTWESNANLLKTIAKRPPDDEEWEWTDDLYKNGNNRDLTEFMDYLEYERDDLDRYKKELEWYKILQKQLRTRSVEDLDDELLNLFYDEIKDDFKPPYHRWGGKPPSVALFIDDCMATDLLKATNRKFINFAIKHRHLYGIGCSLFLTTQAYKSHGGLAKAVRTNICAMMIWKNHNPKEYEAIKEECCAEVKPDDFDLYYNYCCGEKCNQYDFMFVDFFPKKDIHLSPVRKNFDEYIMLNSLKDEKENDT